MCGPTLISAAEKARIAAYDGKFREVTASPFGTDDEIGMLNLIDAESRRTIMSRTDAGTVFDLSVDNFVGMPTFSAAGDQGYQMWMTHTPRGTVLDDQPGAGHAGNELVAYSGDAFSMYTHTGTHIDALNHFGYRDRIFNNFTAHEHLGSRHWHVAGADKHPPILARGILLDIAGLLGVDMLEPSYGIGEQDLADALKHQGTELRPGDVVLIRTGRMQAWPDPQAYLPNGPGINREGAEYLARAGVIMIGADTVGLEQMPSSDPENWQVVHTYLLAEAGVPILEVADLERIAAEKLYEFAFFGACIRLRGATGSPIRPVAMPLAG